jgi:uncharacterized membrane protein YbaN (DUF454 family)
MKRVPSTGTGRPTVFHSAGLIRVCDRGLFGNDTPRECRAFVARTATVAEVREIEIDRRRGVATIRFDFNRVAAGAMLKRLARALQSEGSPGSPPETVRTAAARAVRHDPIRLFRQAGILSSWRITRSRPGAVALRNSAVSDRRLARRLGERLEAERGVREVRASRIFGVTIRYDPGSITVAELLTVLDEALDPPRRPGPAHPATGAAGVAASGVRRLSLLCLGGASFGMAIVGAVVPGIPTVPFLLLSSYFLIRSSPRLNARLLNSRLFGSVLRDWNEKRGLRRRTKGIAIAMIVVVITTSIAFGTLPGPALIIVVLSASVGVYFILRIPTVREIEAPPMALAAASPPQPGGRPDV